MFLHKANPVCAAEILSLHLKREIKQDELLDCWSDGSIIFWLVDGEGQVVLGVNQFFEYLDDFLKKQA